MKLAELRSIAVRLGWEDSPVGPGEALLTLAQDARTSVLHLVEVDGGVWARAVTRKRVDMRPARTDQERVSQPAALRGILDANEALVFLRERSEA